MTLEDWIEGEVEAHNRKVYNGTMGAHAKSVLRDMLRKEDRFWTRFDADHRHGFDDGEPQTSADYNR